MQIPTAYKEVEFLPLIDAVKSAGEEILKIYATDFSVEVKGDDSPLTAADQAANAVLMEYVEDHGTKEFVKKNGEFTVNIALIENGSPSIGVVYQPTTGDTYLGISKEATYKIDATGEVSKVKNETHYSKRDEVIVVASRSHLSDEVMAFVEDLELFYKNYKKTKIFKKKRVVM